VEVKFHQFDKLYSRHNYKNFRGGHADPTMLKWHKPASGRVKCIIDAGFSTSNNNRGGMCDCISDRWSPGMLHLPCIHLIRSIRWINDTCQNIIQGTKLKD
jgi:hypothetical protein